MAKLANLLIAETDPTQEVLYPIKRSFVATTHGRANAIRESFFELKIDYLETAKTSHIEFIAIARNATELVALTRFDLWHEVYRSLAAAKKWRIEIEATKKKNVWRKRFHLAPVPVKELASDDEIIKIIQSEYRAGFAAIEKSQKRVLVSKINSR